MCEWLAGVVQVFECKIQGVFGSMFSHRHFAQLTTVVLVSAVVLGCNSRVATNVQESSEMHGFDQPNSSSGAKMKKAENFTYDCATPTEVLLERASDFDLVNSVFVKIGNRRGNWIDASMYSPEERVIMLVWHSSGIIDNGGFEYLFSGDFDGDPGYRLTAEAYRTVRLTRGYEAFQEAFQLFPNGQMPKDVDERMEMYELADESVRMEINRKHWQDGWDDLREEKLAEYIRANISQLGDLDANN